jgi:hypothetical protein
MFSKRIRKGRSQEEEEDESAYIDPLFYKKINWIIQWSSITVTKVPYQLFKNLLVFVKNETI